MVNLGFSTWKCGNMRVALQESQTLLEEQGLAICSFSCPLPGSPMEPGDSNVLISKSADIGILDHSSDCGRLFPPDRS